MKNFKKILSKLSVIFLLFYSQNIFSMTQTEIQLEKAYLAEMIDIAAEIMEKKNKEKMLNYLDIPNNCILSLSLSLSL